MKKLWFKAKHYGYGWYPATWEGWTVLGVWVVLFLAGEALFIHGISGATEPPIALLVTFAVYAVVITSALIWISAKHGEPARWRWGKPPVEAPRDAGNATLSDKK